MANLEDLEFGEGFDWESLMTEASFDDLYDDVPDMD